MPFSDKMIQYVLLSSEFAGDLLWISKTQRWYSYVLSIFKKKEL